MNRDQLIAIGTEISSAVTVPLTLGALHARTNAADKDSWVEAAILAHSQGRRPVLVGDISRPDLLLASLLRAKSERPQIRFALLLHFDQVLETPMSDSLRSQFDEVFVAVDQAVSVTDAHQVRVSVRPRWLLIPRVGLDWNEVIIGRLLPERRGIATILSPPSKSLWSNEGPFLSADELLIHIQEFQNEHPLIEVRPPPHEWFVPSQTAPWDASSRDRQLGTTLKKSEEQILPNVSFVVPFHWRNQPSDEENLLKCLHSCLRVVDYVYAQTESVTVEYIISVDRDHTVDSFDIGALRRNIDPRIFRSLTVVECHRKNTDEDWRAGFVRNVGAAQSRIGSSGLLVFVDSDIEIVDPAIVANEIIEGRNSLVFSRVRSEVVPSGSKPPSQENQPFQVASSRLLVIRRSLFENLGGFANAFRTYGCEDNFLVWQTSEILRKGLPVSMAAFPFTTTKDLSPSSEDEDLSEKMTRLSDAADLFYRMTFDPRVHRHFFVSLGSNVGLRYLFKRMACRQKLRWLLGPIVFALTLFETNNRSAYLRGLWDVLKWKAKRPILWVSSEIWRVGQAKHVAKKHGWKFPFFFQRIYFAVQHVFGVVVVLGKRAAIKLRATNFGWNIFGWRIYAGLANLWGLLQKLWGAIRLLWGYFKMFLGELRRIALVYIFYPSLHYVKQIPWALKILGIRTLGILGRIWGGCKYAWGGVKFTAGLIHKFAVDWIWVPGLKVAKSPYHLAKLYGWKVVAVVVSPFRYVFDNFWKVKVHFQKLRGELWRIPVWWNRLLGHLWFVPIGFQRLRERLAHVFKVMKEKLRGSQ